MKNLILILTALIGISTGCKKENMPILQIKDATVKVVLVNNPNECISDNIAGTRLEITIQTESNVEINTLVNQYVSSEGQGGKLEYTIDPSQVEGTAVVFEWCYWFENAKFFEEKYKLIGTTDVGERIESNPFTLQIQRPIGAN